MQSPRCACITLAATLFAAGSPVFADDGDVLLVDRVAREMATELPKNGQTMSDVESAFGAPDERFDAVGGDRPQHPPITRWRYSAFTVYFEHDKVIDAVPHRTSENEIGPKPVTAE